MEHLILLYFIEMLPRTVSVNTRLYVCDVMTLHHDITGRRDVTLHRDVMTLHLFAIHMIIGLFSQSALVDHIGVYTDTNELKSKYFMNEHITCLTY